MKKFVIAIDGESASGKGTLAGKLAKHLHCDYLPTGNLYRLVAAKLIESVLEPETEREKVQELIDNLDLSLIYSKKLNREDIAKMASQIAKLSWIREELNKIQYKWIKEHKISILEGRDIGTVICPNAEVKLYLTASNEARARRRLMQYRCTDKKQNITYEEILYDLEVRDQQDSTRINAPLKKAEDAVLIDSSHLTINEVFEQAIAIISKRIC